MTKKAKKVSEYEIGYFYEKEEEAVVSYINANTAKEKNLIFEQSLRPALETMIEIIIKRYKLYQKGEEFNETFDDALAFIISKIDKYNQEKGRAYSYIQKICKNHLIAKINDSNKLMIRNVSYDELSNEINESDKFSYIMPDEESNATSVISATIEELNNEITNENTKLNNNEIMVGKALSEILQNWDEMFSDLGSNKFNKSSILLYIKETTNLPTKEIRVAMKKYKNIYFKTKNSIV